MSIRVGRAFDIMWAHSVYLTEEVFYNNALPWDVNDKDEYPGHRPDENGYPPCPSEAYEENHETDIDLMAFYDLPNGDTAEAVLMEYKIMTVRRSLRIAEKRTDIDLLFAFDR